MEHYTGAAGEKEPQLAASASKADKRAHHNALERKRRDHIKDSFTVLRDSIPTIQGEKVGLSDVVSHVVSHVIVRDILSHVCFKWRCLRRSHAVALCSTTCKRNIMTLYNRCVQSYCLAWRQMSLCLEKMDSKLFEI